MGAVRGIERRRRKTNAVFERAATTEAASEMESDYAKYLCILVSGFVEKSLAELILAYGDGKASRQLLSFLESNLKRLTNVDRDRMLAVVGSLDHGWRSDLEQFVVDERLAALNSIIGLRNDIAHGGDGSPSLRQVTAYWQHAQDIIEHVESIVLAAPRMKKR